VKSELSAETKKRKGRRRPPVIDTDKPGTLDLDNAEIYDIIPFP
jgi:hypothetical protein